MTEIELVIKISEDAYKATCNGNMLPPDVENVVQGIKNGTPLPKGHGRIGDVDQMEYLKALHDAKFGKIKFSEAINKIKNSIPTIVEADKAGNEDDE